MLLDWGICSKGKFAVPALPSPRFFSSFPSSLPQHPSRLAQTHGTLAYGAILQGLRLLLGAIKLLALINPDCLAMIPALPNLQEATRFPKVLPY